MAPAPWRSNAIDHGSAEDGHPLADQELAVRLYFLWSSLPDAELFDLAMKKKLSDPEIYRAQVKRMLAHPNAAALTENFAGQWTRIRKLDEARPTIEFFPSFTPRLKKAMTDEILLFFDGLRKEDRSVLDLLDADYTFVNDELARHYGLKDVKGEEMRKVSLKAESHRGGLASMAGVLAMTSHTNRTSPTLRGKWVLETIFGDPRTPPANVGQIKEEPRQDSGSEDVPRVASEACQRGELRELPQENRPARIRTGELRSRSISMAA